MVHLQIFKIIKYLAKIVPQNVAKFREFREISGQCYGHVIYMESLGPSSALDDQDYSDYRSGKYNGPSMCTASVRMIY